MHHHEYRSSNRLHRPDLNGLSDPANQKGMNMSKRLCGHQFEMRTEGDLILISYDRAETPSRWNDKMHTVCILLRGEADDRAVIISRFRLVLTLRKEF